MPDLHFESSWGLLTADATEYNRERGDEVRNGAIIRTTLVVAKSILSTLRNENQRRTATIKNTGVKIPIQDFCWTHTNNPAIRRYVSQTGNACSYETVRKAIERLREFGFILDKRNHGPKQNYELQINPKYLVFVVDPKTYDFAADSVAELTLRYVYLRFGKIIAIDNQSLFAKSCKLVEPLGSTSVHYKTRLSKHERDKKKKATAAEVAPSVTAPAEPAAVTPSESQNTSFQNTAAVRCPNDAAEAMSRTNGVGEARNSTTARFSASHGESTAPRTVRLLEAAQRLADHAMRCLFLPHFPGVAFGKKQLGTVSEFYFNWLNDCETIESEAATERYLRLMVDYHAVEVRRKITSKIWFNGMQWPSAYYGKSAGAGWRESVKLLQEVTERTRQLEARKLQRRHAETEGQQWTRLKERELSQDAKPQSWKPKKRTDNTQTVGDLLTSFRAPGIDSRTQ